MRVRSTRPTTINPGMGLGPWGPGEERDVDDQTGRLLAAQAGFVEVEIQPEEPDGPPYLCSFCEKPYKTTKGRDSHEADKHHEDPEA